MNVKLTSSLVVGFIFGTLSTTFLSGLNSTSIHKQLATLSASLTQPEALKIAKLIPESLSDSAPIIMSSLWEQAAIGYAAKQLHPGLAEKLDEVWENHVAHHDRDELGELPLGNPIDEGELIVLLDENELLVPNDDTNHIRDAVIAVDITDSEEEPTSDSIIEE